MRRHLTWLLPLVGAAMASGSAKAQWAVFDSSSFMQLEQTVRTLGRQLDQLQTTYAALSGARGLGDVAYDPALREYLPPEWAPIYETAAAGGYAGISGPLALVRRGEQRQGTVAEDQAGLAARARGAAEVDKAVGLRAFDGARARLAQIEALMARINQTRDPKGIQELQARIAIEQAAVQNETTKLQLVAMLQRAEERLIEQRKSDLAQRILSASNKGMPACCSSRVGR